LRKSRIKTKFSTCLVNWMWPANNLSPKQTESEQWNCMYMCWKFTEVDFKTHITILRKRQLVYFAHKCPCSTCDDSQALSGELWHGHWIPIIHIWHCTSLLFLFPKAKITLTGRWFQDAETWGGNLIKCNSFVFVQLFCATFTKL
jgi:hypothetical protein